MARRGDIIVGLDIGTTKVATLVGEVKDDGKIEVIGLGTHPSKGMQKGVITEIESTVEAIQKAVAEAELMAGIQVQSVFAGIAGHHIRGFNSHGIVAVKGKEITRVDVDRVLEQAKAVAIPIDRQVLHAIVQEYLIDSQDGIKVPLGMSGIRLEAKVHIVTSAISAAQNIVRCCNKAGLAVADIVLEPLASSLAVLTDDERDLGVALVDVGGGTADLIIYLKGSVVHTSVLPMGGEFITHDIAIGLSTPMASAEKIKRDHGCAMACMVDKGEMIDVPKVGSGDPKVISRQVLCDIIEARAEEIFTLIHKEIRKTGLEDLLGAGVVLTGGVANLPGVGKLAEELMDVPVRVAVPNGVAGLVDLLRNPIHATGVGLLHYAAKHSPAFSEAHRPLYKRMMDKVKIFLNDFV
ncbi:MAG: cell division protein FtsA [Myxococcales bacterium]|nr:MAG: cell division protein FtsA [Myxococcales bacterium]